MKPIEWKAVDPKYQLRAKCQGTDADLFHEADTDSKLRDRLRKTLCDQCPVISDCFWDNISVPFGMFGGFTWKQRKQFVSVNYGIDLDKQDHYFDTAITGHDLHLRLARRD